ncbi:SDR family oxidoreductase [Alkalihalobacillus sp. 1P02AB]|uniref:SDR family oxidoreductase n=1 Tax=Alkalihalobacillus sp. 1P02AB TaxID=3132260 RepID=UPI0039A50DF4
MKLALVTGANSGFGFLITIELLKQGYTVVATMRKLENRLELVEQAHQLRIEEHLHIKKMDVTNPEEVKKVAEELTATFGQLDILINNAGYCQAGFFNDLELDEWQEQFNVNVTGAFLVTKELLPLLKKSAPAKIINISSVSGFIAFPGLSAYCASKYALEGFSESLRIELLSEQIYVSLIAPGSYQTRIWEKSLKDAEKYNLEQSPFKAKVINQAKEASANAGDPNEVVQLVMKVSQKKKPKLRYPVGKGIGLLYYLKRLLPYALMEKLILLKVKAGN